VSPDRQENENSLFRFVDTEIFVFFPADASLGKGLLRFV